MEFGHLETSLPRRRESTKPRTDTRGFRVSFRSLERWIPAFAGMTVLLLCTQLRAQVAPDTLILYKTIDTVTLNLHTFYPDDYTPDDNRGAIVFFFGGGWNSGNPDQFYNHCDTLTLLGMVCMSAEYRVANTHGTTPVECVLDGNSAIRWVREHARDLGIDPDKIAAGGGSAGGHVAAATSTLSEYDEPDEDLSISSQPNALVLFNPVYDNGPDGYGHSRVEDYWESFSPMHNIDSNTAPTITFLGTADALIPVATAEAYDSLLEAGGVHSELYLYEDKTHGFFNYGRDNNENYVATMSEAVPFLENLGYMEQTVFVTYPGKKPEIESFNLFRKNAGIYITRNGLNHPVYNLKGVTIKPLF